MPPSPPAIDDPGVAPVVALPRQGLPGLAIAGMAMVAALALFLVLDARRRSVSRSATATQGPVSAFAAPPPLSVPTDAPIAPPVMLMIDQPVRSLAPPAVQSFPTAPLTTSGPFAPVSPSPLIVPTAPDNQVAPLTASDPPRSTAARGGGSAFVIDGGGASGGDVPSSVPPSQDRMAATGGGNRSGSGGPGTGGDDAPARVTSIGDQTNIMPIGTMIPAALETPIDTARPGLVRAIVSRDTRGFDGRRVLVPRGSRLIGEYQADVRSGQNRVLVTWNRLIRPDGASIKLVSPTADPLGGAGVPGRVETFFLQRFASALLQSALTVGVNLASRPSNGSVIIGLPSGQINNVVGQTLLPNNDLRPKITVKQGAALNVFVARDLDFSTVAAAP